jgi:uncharacterized lipoprotein YajG
MILRTLFLMLALFVLSACVSKSSSSANMNSLKRAKSCAC